MANCISRGCLTPDLTRPLLAALGSSLWVENWTEKVGPFLGLLSRGLQRPIPKD